MLRLISYLAPSIPHDFFRLVAEAITLGSGIEVQVTFDERISGPLPGDENPFANGSADIGFICSSSFPWLSGELELLPVPVPTDERSNANPVYFSDVVVHKDSPYGVFHDLKGQRWAYNDENSRSGWFSLMDRIAPLSPQEFFSEVINAGSHLESLRMVRIGQSGAAAIDSNTLRNEMRKDENVLREIRILESWGPFPIQPVVIRADIPASIQRTVSESLLRAHESFGPRLRDFGFLRFVHTNRSFYDILSTAASAY